MNPKKSFRERLSNSGTMLMAVVAEMTGRVDKNPKYGRVIGHFGAYKEISTYDISQTNYALTRAIFYANLYKDAKTGTEYGKEYLLGAPFAKPIVNIAAGFAVGAPIQIVENNTTPDAKSKAKPGDVPAPKPTPAPKPGVPVLPEEVESVETSPTISNTNQWLDEQRNFFYVVSRNSMRDGDSFVVMNDDGTMLEVPPEHVDIITDPLAPEAIVGYDIWTSFPDPANEGQNLTYVDEIRLWYRRRMLVDKSEQRTLVAGTLVEYRSAVDGGIEERKLPVVHFANEKEGRMLYGVSEYQSLYYLFANYHAVLAAAIKGNIYNSTALPVVQGVKNMTAFLKQNFKQDKDGNWVLKWDNNKMLVVGEGGSIQMLQADGTAADAQTLLNVLFWLISQNSETPEFVFGTAVQSSKASVSEQAPLLIKKAIRKQGQLELPIRNLIDLYIERLSILKPEDFDADIEYTIDMPDILDKDLNVNIQIVNALLEKGIITEETAMTMLNIGKYVKDFEEELKRAKGQQKQRSPVPTDAFGMPITNPVDEGGNIDKVKKTQAIDKLKKNPKTKAVGEMIEKYRDRFDLATIQEYMDEPVSTVTEFNELHAEDGRFAHGKRSSPAASPKTTDMSDKKSEAVTKFIDKKYGGVAYSDDELRAINDYTGSMFARTNRTLRGANATHPIHETPENAKKTLDTITHLDAAMEKTSLKSDTVLWRAATSRSQFQVGQTLQDNAYGSTSMREQVADVFLGQNLQSSGKPVVYTMKIRAPKGTKGVFVQLAGNNSYENEFIVPRGSQYKITGVRQVDTWYEVEADLL